MNDLLDVDSDAAHPHSRRRGRLPLGDRSASSVRRATRLSGEVILTRLYALVVVAAVPALDLGIPLLISATLVFGVGALYEVLRRLRPSSRGGLVGVSWAVYLTVGVGYAIRGSIGFLIAVPSASADRSIVGVCVQLALFLCLFGSTFVVLIWTLDASSFCLSGVHAASKKAAVRVDCLEQIRHRPHYILLLESLGIGLNPTGSVATPGPETAGSYSRTLIGRVRPTSVPTILGTLAGAFAVTLGLSLIDYSGNILLPLLIGLVTGLLMTALPVNWIPAPLILACVTVIVAADSAVGRDAAALIPMVSLALIVAAFRRLSYFELKYGFRAARRGLRLRTGVFTRRIVGETIADAFQLPSRQTLEQYASTARRAGERIG